jgi:hypothetical protein
VAFDHFGNLFVASTTFDGTSYQGTILEITPLGVQTTFASVDGDLYLAGLAIDSSDNVFVMALTSGPNFASIIYKFTPDGVQSTFGSIPTPSQSFGLAFDQAGNLFAADTFNQTVFKFAPDGTRSVFVGRLHLTLIQDPRDWPLTGAPIYLCRPTASSYFLAMTRFSNLLRKE